MWAEISPKEKDLTGLGNFIVLLMNWMTIGKHLSLAFRKHLVSLWPHLKSLLQISLWFVESQLSELSREMVFWAWTNQSMAVGPMVIWSLHATWCCWCVRDMFWIWQVHHHSNSVNGLLELSLGTGFSFIDWLSVSLCPRLGPCCIFEQPDWEVEGWWWGEISFSNELCYRYLGKYVWCVHCFDENVTAPKGQTFVMLVLLAKHSNIP